MKILFRKLARRFALLARLNSVQDWWLFFQLFFFALFVPLIMLIGVKRLSPLLSRVGSGSSSPDYIKRVIAFTDLAMEFGTPLVRKRCLTRGITLYYFLRRAGIPVALYFGVAPEEQLLKGHCWLVENGQPFAEHIDPRTVYTHVWSLPIEV